MPIPRPGTPPTGYEHEALRTPLPRKARRALQALPVQATCALIDLVPKSLDHFIAMATERKYDLERCQYRSTPPYYKAFNDQHRLVGVWFEGTRENCYLFERQAGGNR